MRMDAIIMKSDWYRLEKCLLEDKPISLIRLFSNGTSPDLRDECGTTLLMHACGTANLKFIFILASFGARIDLVNHGGESALEYLCAYNDDDEVSRIIIFNALMLRSKKNNNKEFLRNLETFAKARRLLALSKVIRRRAATAPAA